MQTMLAMTTVCIALLKDSAGTPGSADCSTARSGFATASGMLGKSSHSLPRPLQKDAQKAFEAAAARASSAALSLGAHVPHISLSAARSSARLCATTSGRRSSASWSASKAMASWKASHEHASVMTAVKSSMLKMQKTKKIATTQLAPQPFHSV